MAFILAVTWTAKPGNEQEVHEILRKLREASNQEPGVITYEAHVDPITRGNFLFTRFTTMPVASKRTRKRSTSNNWWLKKPSRYSNSESASSLFTSEQGFRQPKKTGFESNPVFP